MQGSFLLSLIKTIPIEESVLRFNAISIIYTDWLQMFANLIISLVTGLAALSASLIAMFTLFEIRKQRKEANKPELAIKSSHLNIYGFKFSEFYFPFVFSKQELNNENSIKNFISDFRLELVNVGIQSAKNIKTVWKYDFKKAIEIIEKRNIDGLFNFKLSQGGLEIIFPKANFKEMNFIDNQLREQHFDFLIKASSESLNAIYLSVPDVVLKLYMIYISLICGYYKENDKKIIGEEDNLPDLGLSLKYEDISGVPYNKDFQVVIEFSTLMNPMQIKLKHSIGSLVIIANEVKT